MTCVLPKGRGPPLHLLKMLDRDQEEAASASCWDTRAELRNKRRSPALREEMTISCVTADGPWCGQWNENR